MTSIRWDIITGEYPPQPGGVSDYTWQVAHGLAQAGDEVHVWAPVCAQVILADTKVYVHRLPGCFGPRALARLDAALHTAPRSSRILLQYVPHAFGWKAMNVPLCLWLLTRSRASLWVMFHEVALPWNWRRPVAYTVLGAVTRLMAALLARAAERRFVSIPAWGRLLQRLAPRTRAATWLPVPSTIPTTANAVEVAAVRERMAPQQDDVVIGHFGTYGKPVASLLAELLPPLLLADTQRTGLLLGQGGEQFAARLCQAHPELRGRLYAPGSLPRQDVAVHLAACDLLVQPYPDGVSSRRTSLMAGLALGLPIVTTTGALTESVWQDSGAVSYAPASSPPDCITAAEAVLGDSCLSHTLRRRAALLYTERFALAHTIQALRTHETCAGQ